MATAERARNYQNPEGLRDVNEDEADKIIGPEEFIQRQTNRQIGEDVTRILNEEQAAKADAKAGILGRTTVKIDGVEAPAEVVTAEVAQEAQGTQETQAEEAGDFSGMQDKYGGPAYSQETMERMAAQGMEQDPAEMEREAAIQAAREEGYHEAQAEIQGILAGRSVEQCLSELTQDIDHLQAEIERMRQIVYFDPGMRAYHRGQIALAQEGLASMERRRGLVQSLQGGEIAVPAEERQNEEVGDPEMGDFGNQVDDRSDELGSEMPKQEDLNFDFNEDLDFNVPNDPGEETEKAVIGASYANVSMDLRSGASDPGLVAGLAEALKAYNERQRTKARERVDEAVQAVKNGELDISGVDELDVTAGVPGQNNGQEASPATGEANGQREKLSEPERKGKIKAILERVRNSKPLARLRYRVIRSAAVVLATAMMMIAATPGAANAEAAGGQTSGNDTTTESVAEALERVNAAAADEGVNETEVSGWAQETVDRWAALGIDVESIQSDQSELDLSKYDVKGIGLQILEGVKEQDGTETIANGVTGNFVDYYHGEKESANAYGSNPGDLINAKDRDSKTIDAILERYALLPVGLATFVSMSPHMMSELGLDESITSIKDDRERGQAVWKWLTGEGGIDAQASAIGMMSIMLVKGQTNMDFYYENGDELTAYITRPEAGYEGSFEQLGVGIDSVKRDHAPQVMITVTFEDGTQEIFDMNINCGFQLNYAKTGGSRKPIINTGKGKISVQMDGKIIGLGTGDWGDPQDLGEGTFKNPGLNRGRGFFKPGEKPGEKPVEKPEEPGNPETPEEPTVPAPTTPEVVWPGEEPTPEPQPAEPEPEPQPQPEPEPQPEEPKDETPAVKNPEAGKQVIENGDKSGELEPTLDVTTTVEPTTIEDVTPDEGNRGEKEENTVIESPEAGQTQWEANEAQDQVEPLTPEQVADIVDVILSQQAEQQQGQGQGQGQTGQGQQP